MTSIWIREYQPSKTTGMIGLNKEIGLVKKYIQNHKKKNKAIFLYGGNGNGKTSSVYALAKELNYELIELNSSDSRKQANMVELLENAINQGSLFGTNKIILLDELDGLSGVKDRGAVSAIAKIIPKSNYPIILIAHDAYTDKLKPLRKISELVEFTPRTNDDLFEILQNICKKEKVEYDEEALKQLARTTGGDVRAAINDLQTLSAGKTKITSELIKNVGTRNTTKKIEEALTRIFKTTQPEIALGAFDDVNVDLDKIFLWVEENMPKEYLEPEHLANAFDNLSLSDVFYGRIRRWQYYRFYVYCYQLLTAGISISKDKKYPGLNSYKPSSRILKIWMAKMKNMKKKAIAQKVADNTHTSNRIAFNSTVPFLQVIFKNNPEQADLLSEQFDLSDEEVDWLRK